MIDVSANLQQQAGQGDAYVFHPFDNSGMLQAMAHKREYELRRAKMKQEHDKELRDKYQFNSKSIWSPLQVKHQERAVKLLQNEADLNAKGVESNHPLRIAQEAEKSNFEQDINKGKELEAKYLDGIGRNDPAYNNESIASDYNDIVFGKDRKGMRDVRDISLQDFDAPHADPKNLNITHVAQAFSKTLPDNIKSYITKERTSQGEGFNENLVKSKYYQYDAAGKQLLDPDGKEIINITPESKHAFYNSHPLVKPWVDRELQKPENKGKTEDDIVKSVLSPYAVNESNTSISGMVKYDKPSGEGTKNELAYNGATITQNIKDGETHNMPGITLKHKDKSPVIMMAPSNIYNLGTSKHIEAKNSDLVPVDVSSLTYNLQTKGTKKIVAFKSPDDMERYIKTASKSDLDKLDLKQFMIGNIGEKLNTTGDTKSGSGVVNNKTVAVEYNPSGEAAAQFNTYSGGTFKDRKLTEGEQRIVDAWKSRMNSSSVKSPAKENPFGL